MSLPKIKIDLKIKKYASQFINRHSVADISGQEIINFVKWYKFLFQKQKHTLWYVVFKCD